MFNTMTTWSPIVLVGALALAGCRESQPAPSDPASETPTSTGSPAPGAAATPTPPPSSGPANPTSIEVSGITFTIDGDWPQRASTGQFAPAAQFQIGDNNAALIKFYGEEMGPAQMNIDRWVSQVGNPTSDPDKDTFTRDGMTFNTLAIAGDISPTMGAAPIPGWTLYGAIIEGGPATTVYIKATAPTGTLDRAAWDGIIESARVAE